MTSTSTSRSRFQFSKFIRPDAISIIVGILAWEVYGQLQPAKLTPFTEVIVTFWRMLVSGEFSPILSTMTLFVVAVSLSIVLALLTAAAMSGSKTFSNLIRPYLYVFLGIPPLVLVPIFMLVWGTIPLAVVVAVIFFAYFPMAVIFAESVEEAPEQLIEMASAFGATPARVFIRVQIPAVAGRLVAGGSLGVIRGLKGSVTTEVLMGVVGIGGLLRTFSAGFQLPQLYATVVMIVIFSLVIYIAVHLLEQWIRRRTG